MIKLGIGKIISEGLCRLTSKERFQHLFLIGSTGRGKTTFFLNLIQQEIDNAVIVVDPYGELVLKIASIVPKERLVYIDKDHPIGLNPLDRPHLNRTILSQEFEKLINMVASITNENQLQLTYQMIRIIRHATRVIKKEDLNIEYLVRFLDNKIERNKYQKDEYWARFDGRTKDGIKNEQPESAQRISARLSLFESDENLLPFLTGQNEFDIPQFIKEKKVVLINLDGFDELAMAFLGCLVTTFIRSYRMHQASIGGEPLFCYLDEFQYFITSDFHKFLTECRKYNISLNFSCHNLDQVDQKLLKTALSSYCLVLLGLEYEDAVRIGKNIQTSPDKLVNIEQHHAIISIRNKPYFVRCYPPTPIEDYVPDRIDSSSLVNIDFLEGDWIETDYDYSVKNQIEVKSADIFLG
jgi:type IV secretory pathway VirB4 component